LQTNHSCPCQGKRLGHTIHTKRRVRLVGATRKKIPTVWQASFSSGGNSTALEYRQPLRRLHISDRSRGEWKSIQPFGARFPAAEKLIFDGYSFYYQPPGAFPLIWDLSRLRSLKLFSTDLSQFLYHAEPGSLTRLRSLTLRRCLPSLQYHGGSMKRKQLKAHVRSMFKNFANLEKLVIWDDWEYFLENDAVSLNCHTLLRLQFGGMLYDRQPISLGHLKPIRATCLGLQQLCVIMRMENNEVSRLRGPRNSILARMSISAVYPCWKLYTSMFSIRFIIIHMLTDRTGVGTSRYISPI